MRIVLVTGLSAGKSAIRVLEDAGYYCVDNLPPQFLLELASYLDRTGHHDVAVSVDARSEATLADVPMMVSTLRTSSHDVRVLFLTASDAALVQRFSETRRRHPMALRELERGASTVTEAISLERALLEPLAEIGHAIDTSALHPNLLRHWVRQFVDSPRANLTLSFESFAFKDGIPVAADLVFDVRNLPNPHYDLQLRPLTGRDEAVVAFLLAAPRPGNDQRHCGVYRKMAAEFGRKPALCDSRDRLHRRAQHRSGTSLKSLPAASCAVNRCW